MHHSNLVVLLSSLIRPNVFKTTKDRCIQNIKSMRNCLGLVGMFLILRSADVLKPCGGSSQTWDNSIWLCFATLHNPPGWRPNCLLHSFLCLHEDLGNMGLTKTWENPKSLVYQSLSVPETDQFEDSGGIFRIPKFWPYYRIT